MRKLKKSIVKRIAKKMLSIALVMGMVLTNEGVMQFGANVCVAYAETYESENGYEYEINYDGVSCEITKWSGDETDLIIPGEIDGYRVIRIGEYALEWYKEREGE